MLYTYSFAGSLIYFPIFHIYVGVCIHIYQRISVFEVTLTFKYLASASA